MSSAERDEIITLMATKASDLIATFLTELRIEGIDEKVALSIAVLTLMGCVGETLKIAMEEERKKIEANPYSSDTAKEREIELLTGTCVNQCLNILKKSLPIPISAKAIKAGDASKVDSYIEGLAAENKSGALN